MNNAQPTRRPAYEIVQAGLRKRYRAERRFRFLGGAAIVISLMFLAILFADICGKGLPAFRQTHIKLPVYFDAALLPANQLEKADYQSLVKQACRTLFPDVKDRRQKRALYGLVSSGAGFKLRQMVLDNPAMIGTTREVWVAADDGVDMLTKGQLQGNTDGGRFSPAQLSWIGQLEDKGRLRRQFNVALFTNGDSRDPELSGVWGAFCGSCFTLLVTLMLSFPIGVAAAIYLEEFAPRNRWTEFIEVNINNLAAVPSIIFGLLGLAVFINFFGLPRSAPLVGGFVLTLMTLPTIIIAGRAALKSVPPSIREAALGIGASHMQTVMHHVLPLAMPGMLTGTIIGMARALGETAPLLMIGMVAFIVDIPTRFTSPATALPVQIYLWADSPERAFIERTSAAIIVLLLFLITMNATAVFLRKKFERRW
ncbi:MAG: phosphate ABC transporter permease PstA [Deltaproteobacteria bacterium]|nr:phosphate ABC transporter permease PstA [Candidatus Anaeroferrophillus wilburensis]MBN2887889.1 phosphate ABC transporter permease PstA [Deltaproteobacteria bacterium]